MNSHYYDVQFFSQRNFTHNLKNGNINALITTTTLKLLKKKKNANSL